jgi:hypothetical protein
MSEKDMKLGGIAATKFIDKSLSTQTTDSVAADGSTVDNESNAYSGTASGIYKTSDQVREHYFRQIEHEHKHQHAARDKDDSPFSSSNRQGGQHHQSSSSTTSTTPTHWNERQQMRQLEAEGFKNQAPAANQPQSSGASAGSSGSANAHVALVKVATHALEGLAGVLEHDNTASIPMEERAAFAKAIQRAMQALAAAKN